MIKVRVQSIFSGWEIQNSIQSPKEIQTQKKRPCASDVHLNLNLNLIIKFIMNRLDRLLLFPFVLKFRSQKVIIESFTNEKREEKYSPKRNQQLATIKKMRSI